MTLTKTQLNIIFACIVAALALTAITFLYQNRDRAEVTVPHTHPPQADPSEKIAALQQMIDREPGNPDYLTQIGNLYYDIGQHDKAVEYYQRSLNLRPQDPNVETDMATSFHYLGQHNKSLEILNNVLSYNPGFAQARFNKGIVLIEGKNDVRGGIAVWEELLRTDPNFQHRAELQERINNLRASLK